MDSNIGSMQNYFMDPFIETAIAVFVIALLLNVFANKNTCSNERGISIIIFAVLSVIFAYILFYLRHPEHHYGPLVFVGIIFNMTIGLATGLIIVLIKGIINDRK